MRRVVLLPSVLVAAACAAPAPAERGAAGFPVPAGTFAPRTYRAPRAARPPVIDGRLDDPAWAAAPWTEEHVDISGPGHAAPRHRTRNKITWDDTCVYFAAELEEPHLWATYTERDSVIYHENDWEVFLDPDGDTHHYFELEINVLGTEWDLLLVKPYRDGGPALHEWDAPGLRTAVRAEGTVNDARDTDRGWTVEVAWPWASLAAAAGTPCPPRPGDRWRVNFSRVQWRVHAVPRGYAKDVDPATGRPRPEDNWVWSPQGLVAMHYPELWGVVEFAESPGQPPALTADDHVRYLLYEAYYAQRRFRESHGRWARDRDELLLAKTHPTLRVATTATAFEMRLAGADGRDLVIREDGRTFVVARE